MVTVDLLNFHSSSDMKAFIELPFSIHKDVAAWVPPIRMDIRTIVNPKKHPFYEHSDAEAFIARRDGAAVGRIVMMENRLYNEAHDTKVASFSLLECVDDVKVLTALMDQAAAWARARGLTELVGPKPFDLGGGYGVLIEGFEHRQMMTMMNYNLPYLPKLMEEIGFEKVVDFVSCSIDVDKFNLPEKVHRVAERVLEKGTIRVQSFKKSSELRAVAEELGELYNEVFIHNWEYYPYTKKEIKTAVDNVIMFADPGLIKVLWAKDKVIGFLFAFPDVSEVLQKHKGRLNPFSIVDLLRAKNGGDWVSVNGMGVLEDYYGRGGNALLYSEMEKTVKSRGFKYAEFTQVAESAEQMRKDLLTLGGAEVKNHRVYRRAVG